MSMNHKLKPFSKTYRLIHNKRFVVKYAFTFELKGDGYIMGWLTIGSLVLGLIAWILPVVNIFRSHNNNNWAVLSMLSISACVISLYFQLLYNNYLVKIEDWSALMDTSGGVVVAGSVLLVITLLLNIMTFVVYRNRTPKVGS